MLERRKFRKYRHFEHSKMKIRLKGLVVTIGIESGVKLTIGEKLPHATRTRGVLEGSDCVKARREVGNE